MYHTVSFASLLFMLIIQYVKKRTLQNVLELSGHVIILYILLAFQDEIQILDVFPLTSIFPYSHINFRILCNSLEWKTK